MRSQLVPPEGIFVLTRVSRLSETTSKRVKNRQDFLFDVILSLELDIVKWHLDSILHVT